MNKDQLFQELIKKVSSYMDKEELTVIKKAYYYADEAHAGQFRKSQQPYITHPIEVAMILANLEMGSASVSAALLHDTLEDTKLTRSKIDREFGREIGKLVEGVTKLGKIDFKSTEEEASENYRKMFVAMAKDIRVIVLKLADRLHNMRTLRYKSKEKQQKISVETREIFCPIAHRLGMWRLKWELEDLCFCYLDPENYEKMSKLVVMKREAREKYVQDVCDFLKELVEEVGIAAVIRGRPKHLFSIYQKLINQGLEFEELYDTLGIRIILESSKDCYEVLGLIHAEFKPISGRFKDYIATPKPNLYQSIHTTVIGPKGKPIEIQIRTKVMHEIAEFGIAAHWHYKEGKEPSNFDGDLSWLRQIIEKQKETLAPKEFLRDLKVELFVEDVFVFTPRGDMIVMDSGSTPLDFAYRVHTEIGHACVGAKVNGRIVGLSYILRNGDRVEVLTQKSMEPKLSWLQIVTTTSARHKIRERLKRKSKAEQIKMAKFKLAKFSKDNGFDSDIVLQKIKLKKALKKYGLTQFDDLLIRILHDDIDSYQLLHFIQKTYPKTVQQHVVKLSEKHEKALQKNDVKPEYASCCFPLKGDSILAYSRDDNALVIHRRNCSKLSPIIDNTPAKLLDLSWDRLVSNDTVPTLPSLIQVDAFNRDGIIFDIMDYIGAHHISLKSFNTTLLEEKNRVVFHFLCMMKSQDHFLSFKEELLAINDVVQVARVVA